MTQSYSFNVYHEFGEPLFDYPLSAKAGICLAIMVGLITFVLFISASVGMRILLYRGTWRRLYCYRFFTGHLGLAVLVNDYISRITYIS